MFTKADYIVIANILRSMRPAETALEYGLWVRIWSKFEDRFRLDNDRFDSKLFRQALYR